MAIFESAEQFKDVELGFLEKLAGDPSFGPKFAAMKMNLKYNIKDINQEVWLIHHDGIRVEVIWGPTNAEPTVELTLSTDHFHKFWAKQMSVAGALASGDVAVKGPIPKILKLVSMLKPAFDLYSGYITNKGLAKLESA